MAASQTSWHLEDVLDDALSNILKDVLAGILNGFLVVWWGLGCEG